MRLPRMRRRRAVAADEQVDAAEPKAVGRHRPGLGAETMIARPVVDLPEPGFADDAEPLAPEA